MYQIKEYLKTLIDEISMLSIILMNDQKYTFIEMFLKISI